MRTFEQIRKILKTKTIGIAGAGGLGSNVAISLTRTGVGNLIVADYNVVQQYSLNRHYYFYDQIGMKKVYALQHIISKTNPETNYYGHDVKLTEDNIMKVFADCDVIVEAIGDAHEKMKLIETVLVEMPEKYLVIGSGLAGYGKSNRFSVEQFDKLYVCGDQEAEVNVLNPPLAPGVGIVANMQANEVLSILLK